MLLFFEHVLIGCDEQKLKYFEQLVDSNETLMNLIIEKNAKIGEFNEIIDFLNDMSDEEV